MKNFRILVTGSDGQLGKELKFLSHLYKDYTFFFKNKTDLSIDNYKSLKSFIKNNKVKFIINCAAITKVDYAEDNYDLAYEVNANSVKNIAELCKKFDVGLIHISTDYVFDGKSKLPYKESDKTNPLNVYGKTKLLGEKLLNKINPKNSIIIRTSWLYSIHNNNFIMNMCNKIKNNETIKVVDEQYGSPTFARDLALVILNIIPKIKSKNIELFHYANLGVTSRINLVQKIMKALNSNLNIKRVRYFKSKALRPKYSALNSLNISSTYKLKINHWEKSLDKFLNEI